MNVFAERYSDGIIFQLRDESALLNLHSFDEAKQLALKDEDKCHRPKGKWVKKRSIAIKTI